MEGTKQTQQSQFFRSNFTSKPLHQNISGSQLGSRSPRAGTLSKPGMMRTIQKIGDGNKPVQRSRQARQDEFIKSFPPEVLEPKVFAEYNPAPGKIPRHVYIEKAKKRYLSMDIEQLLRTLGIDYSIPPDPDDVTTFMKLELFDNTDFDIRKPIDWINLGKKADLKAKQNRKEKNREAKIEKRRLKRKAKGITNEDEEENAINEEELSASEEEELFQDIHKVDFGDETNEDNKDEQIDEVIDEDDDIPEDALLLDEEAQKLAEEGKADAKLMELNDEPQFKFAPYAAAPVPVPARAARFKPDQTARWDLCSVVGLVRMRDEPTEGEEEKDDEDEMDESEREEQGSSSSEQKDCALSDEERAAKEARQIEKHLKKLRQIEKDAEEAEQKGKSRKKGKSKSAFTHEMFEVQWLDNTRSVLPRIHVLFFAEDPERFALRVLWAHQRRKETALQLKYNLYIDAMPTDDVALPSQESLEHIMEIATLSNFSPLHHTPQPVQSEEGNKRNTKGIGEMWNTIGEMAGATGKQKSSGGTTLLSTSLSSASIGMGGIGGNSGLCVAQDTNEDEVDEEDESSKKTPLERRFNLAKIDSAPFLREVAQIYCKSMNTMVFEQMRKDEAHSHMFEGVELPPPHPPKEVPEQGTILTPPHNMQEAQLQLMKKSFLTTPQIIQVLIHIRSECNTATSLRLFNLPSMKDHTMQLEELQTQQSMASSAVVSFLNEKWMGSLRQAVANALQSIPSSMFSGAEDSPEAYEQSRLKVFFSTVTFMMQDALRTMMQTSIEEFTSCVTALSPDKVTVRGMNDATVSFKRRPIRRAVANYLSLLREKERAERRERMMRGEQPDEYEEIVVEEPLTEEEIRQRDEELKKARRKGEKKPDKKEEEEEKNTKTVKKMVRRKTLTEQLCDKLCSDPPLPTPLLSVEIEWTAEEAVHTSVPLAKFVDVPMNLLDTAINICQEFVRLDAQMMPKLFKARRDLVAERALSSMLTTSTGFSGSYASNGQPSGSNADGSTTTGSEPPSRVSSPSSSDETNASASVSASSSGATSSQQNGSASASSSASSSAQAAQSAPLTAEERAKREKMRLAKRRRMLEGFMYLSVLNAEEEFSQQHTEKLKAALTRAVEPLKEYVATFAPIHTTLSIDTAKLAEEICTPQKSPSEIAQKVKEYRQKASEVDTLIPNEMNLGLFMVSCVKIKQMLTKKYQDMARALIDAMGNRVMEQADALISKYQAILSKMTERPRNAEELVQKKEFLATIPKELNALQPELDAMKETYDTLEQFDHTFTEDEFKKHWSGYGWAKQILGECEETEQNLMRHQKIFEEQLISNQEKFARQLQEVTIMVSRLSRHANFDRVDEVYQEVSKLDVQLEDMKKKQKEFSLNEGLLGREITEYPELNSTAKKFDGYNLLWSTANNWSHWAVEWREAKFNEIDAVQMDTQLSKALSNMQRCIKLFREVPEPQGVAQLVKSQMDELAPRMPLVVALRNPGMKDRHWKQIETELGFDIRPQEDTTLDDMLNLDLEGKEDVVLRIADVAAKEYALEEALIEMHEEWQPIQFEIKEYKATKTYVMYGAAEIQERLDMHLLRTQAMSFSPFKEPHKDAIENWLNLLQRISLVIEEWLKCQKRWIYLEPIFSSEDIQRQLPIEYKRFQGVDRSWRRIMSQAHAKPVVVEFCAPDNLLNTFQEMFNVLESVANGLESYLETKRKAFPRFYFLSSDELLDILSQTKDPTRVQPYLGTCFEAIKSVTFQPDMEITAMISKEKEKVEFVEGIYPEGNVEQWLKELEGCMFTAVRDQIVQSLADYNVRPRKEWVGLWPGQVVLCVGQIYWTQEVEQSIEKGGYEEVDKLLTKLKGQLNDLTDLVRGNLTDLQRLTLGALITIDVHARDVTTRLVENKVEAVTDFDWISQFRYYWEDDDVHVKMMQTDFMYQYEYLGNTSRLVITPLTDKLYMTLMGAINLHLGGAPAGPAGTGKTETTKDLAKAVAVKCVVFNCSESLKVTAMGKFFKGLAMTGAWSCFDEFNRIDIEVLSVIAQQIATIQNAIMDGLEQFHFEDDEITLIPTLSIFITMNPGYAGRTELPDNLKALFRPVAVMIPDYALIAEIRLFSFGFKEGFALSKKMVATFKLSSEQLSSQDHYDFGMRAVNTVISAAGNLKHEFPDVSEELLLLRALRDTNIPKFLADDIPLFKGIVSDLFPGVEPMVVDYGQLNKALIDTASLQQLQPREAFITKCLQLYETAVLRHGLMLVGPTGGGKSSCLSVLSTAMTTLKKRGVEGYETVIMHKLNPKSIPYGDLYGTYDAATNDWKNGVLTLIMRECVRDESSDKHWIICDGPVDAVWIEDMNTVLDDSKKLCLASGEVIPLTPAMNMIFEVEDLRVASPATVSRCGMVYLEPSTTVPHSARIFSWLNSQQTLFAPHIDALQELFDIYLPQCLNHLRRSCPEAVPTVDANICMAFFNMLEAMFMPYLPEEAKGETMPTQQKLEDMGECLPHIFIFALVWSVGATTNVEGRKSFNEFLMTLIRENHPDLLDTTLEQPTDAQPMKGSLSPNPKIPAIYTLYDFVYNQKEKVWIPWMDTIDEYVIKPKTAFTEMIVPTVDSVRNTHIINLLVRKSKHVLTIGSTGTAKTVTLQQYLFKQAPSEYIPIPMTFSAQTSATATQRQLDDKFERRRSGIVGAPPGSKFVIFVDDLNMPKLEIYGAQPPIELLRQFVDHGGWYVKKDSTSIPFFKIEDVQLVGAMGPPGGGRNPVTNRFLRHFNHIYFTDLEESSEKMIFSTILGSFFNQFPDIIRGLTTPIVNATVEVYHTIMRELLPTPQKSHYTFNLRDLSKVFQGILSGDVRALQETSQVIRIWLHETTRVFADRLVTSTKDTKDREWFQQLLRAQLKKHFSVTWEGVGASDNMMFGDLLSANQGETKPYVQITDIEKLKKVLDDALDDYRDAQKGGSLELVLFQNAIMHLLRIARIIRQPYGNALLLGVGGSGRQSLTRLASFIAEYTLRNIEIKKGFNTFEWHKTLKDIMKGAGLEAMPTVFLFSDTQLVQESFLEDINNMLNSGDVPNVWDPQEMETIYSTMRPIAQSLGIIPTKINLFSHFVKRVRENIHIVLCMSPFGDAFRNRLRMYPALVTCCTIDWFDPWPDEALRAVARVKLDDVDFESNPLGDEEESEDEDASGSDEEYKMHKRHKGEDLTDKVIEMCVMIHQSVEKANTRYLKELKRTNHVTPLSYLELITTLRTMLKNKREELKVMKNRLSQGVEKITKATEEVVKNDARLKEVQPQLEKMTIEVEQMMVKIQKDQQDASEQRTIVKREEQEVSAQAEQCQKMKDEATALLEKALPILREAEKSLEKLDPRDVAEVGGYKSPGKGVQLVLAALCIVMGVPPAKIQDPDHPNQKKEDYMGPARGLVSHPRELMDSMLNFDKEHLDPKMIKKIEPYIQNEEFIPEKVAKGSKACMSICIWIRAMYSFYFTFLDVKPKQELVAKAEKELAAVLKTLKEKQDSLNILESNIKQLEARYQEAIEKKESLQKQVHDCVTQRDRAFRLTQGLGGECTRWTKEMKDIEQLEYNVMGDVLISAGTVCYLGPFTSQFRADLITQWKEALTEMNFPFSANASIQTTFADPVRVRQWGLDGLPSDNLSIENGLIMINARRWPLMIDPQGQANKWIRRMEKGKLDIVKQTEDNFMRTMETAIRFGRPVLIESVGEELDPALEPVLSRTTFMHKGSEMMKLGDTTLPYNNNFKLYMTTKLPNPKYAPETSVKVTLLNFTVTQSGLEDQLLATVVVQERPDLEESKNSLMSSNAKMRARLKEYEDQILKLLSETANPLEDETLINTLSESKKMSTEIEEKVKEAEETEQQIDETRNTYRPMAVRGSLLFFCVADLSSIDPMYQNSLQWFMDLYKQSIEETEQSQDFATRLSNLMDNFTYLLYQNVCRSLFARHKLMFSFLMIMRILTYEGKIDQQEYRFLIGRSTVANPQPNPAEDWLTSRSWIDIQALAELPAFTDLDKDFAADPDSWRVIFDSSQAHREPLPGKWNDLNQFQKLLVLKCLRSDKITEGVQDFVQENFGKKYVQPPNFNLAKSYRDSNSMRPLIFIISPGTNPAKDLDQFAVEMRMTKKLHSLSLGQGQGVKAEQYINEATENGFWVLLQNCDLYASWMPELERIVENWKPESVHREFRLWLTSQPSEKFPVSILQSGIKMTNEPPKGLQANLLRTYESFDPSVIAPVSDNHDPSVLRMLLFSLSFFHAVIQERRKFGALGWNIRYEFTVDDLNVCIKQLRLFLETSIEVPYRVLSFLFGEINYGGRVTDFLDRRLLSTLLERFICPDVLKEGYTFSPSGKYTSVDCEDLKGYIQVIQSYDLNAYPEVFGLHENADITCAMKDTNDLFDNLLSLQPSTASGSSGQTREEIIQEKVLSIQEKVPHEFDLEAASAAYPTSYEESMNTVLVQEIIRYNRLLSTIHTSLDDMIKALAGKVVMSAALEDMSNSLFINQIPKLWEKPAYPSLKALSVWVEDLAQRCAFLAKWIENGPPAVYWISGLFFPQAFLTGNLQNFARKYKIPIDKISFEAIIRDDLKNPEEVTERPADGCFAYGLFLEGARWDHEKHVLTESRPKELYTTFPIIHLNPVENRVPPTEGSYNCPIYKILTRQGTLSTTGHSTNYVISLDIPSDTVESHWIKRSVALFCALDY
ncbi:dynein haevy chain 8, inner dynein arm 4 [Monocercomonoides exilis]|uniref:dynein haevy chain 8, inner dynein arm 4 n=1 Tax=Monocercomonoides exilis TaxID=2049356 RepID=UPI00355A4260|nr:dynein haevy chain 8, inner dynein arm 4 [Monocercomonoides exilis]|eukprot:MONOS_9258.1-p1 / transcript=MONOS_9258.1 / gene=MONOS_9258 / organism=Monocercomonoides_exilis_PA203 / gene_product=dynein haevy chain 8, inner dynein arm 4 / transcript_product=dynein haevy chain 8, inner dynein arm 4 / location=Mono_scaffold00375:28044-42152(-) / protein_length=4676 / sequence_SO=supercontig / SO=protein_coding / is_pseudo=false